MTKLVWNRGKKNTTVITEKPIGELRWRRFIIILLNGEKQPYIRDEITHYSKEEYLKNNDYEKDRILSITEVESAKSTQNCPACGKPFKIGDRIIRYHDLAEHTLVYIDERMGYFGEHYLSDDSLDMQEQLRYIVHSSDVRPEIIAEFKHGQELWVQGMDICNKIQHNIFKF